MTIDDWANDPEACAHCHDGKGRHDDNGHCIRLGFELNIYTPKGGTA